MFPALKDPLVDIRKRCCPSSICLWGEVCSSKVNHVLLPDKGIEQLDDLCIDYWLFVLIISLSILSTERQGTAMYYLPDEGIEQLQRCGESISSKLKPISQPEVVVRARIPDEKRYDLGH